MSHARRLLVFAMIVCGLVSLAVGQTPTFDVASVTVNRSGDFRKQIGPAPGGRFVALNQTLRELMPYAARLARGLVDLRSLQTRFNRWRESGSVGEGTRHVVSPAIPSASRLVARIVRPGLAAAIVKGHDYGPRLFASTALLLVAAWLDRPAATDVYLQTKLLASSVLPLPR